jgi:hypothetical protein
MATNYLPKILSKHAPNNKPGRYYNPDKHKYKDQEQRNRYYAYMRHKAQARYRGEAYELTADDWFDLWTPELFEQRGREADKLCLARVDPEGAWSKHNCEIITRKEFLQARGSEQFEAK